MRTAYLRVRGAVDSVKIKNHNRKEKRSWNTSKHGVNTGRNNTKEMCKVGEVLVKFQNACGKKVRRDSHSAPRPLLRKLQEWDLSVVVVIFRILCSGGVVYSPCNIN